MTVECPEGYDRIYARYADSMFDVDVPNNDDVVDADEALKGGSEIVINPTDVIEIRPENGAGPSVFVLEAAITVAGASKIEIQFYDESGQELPNSFFPNPVS